MDGISYEQAAERMGLSVARVRLLVAQERDNRELKALKQNWVETGVVRAFVDRELERDPELSRSQLAHWLDMELIDFERQLGYRPKKNGSVQQQTGVRVASRVAIALGRAPHEIDGC